MTGTPAPALPTPKSTDASVEARVAELLRSTLGVPEPEDQKLSSLAAGGP